MLLEPYPGRPTPLGPLTVWRALPARGRRMIGPWCFLDRYGPLSFTDDKPMDVAPHPHIGIQTVSWLLEGEVIHHDTLGCEGLVRPGGVNVMTAGRGIAHAEETPKGNSGRLNGVQLWVALPEVHRHVTPAFQHVPEVPQLDARGANVRQFLGGDSPAATFSDIVGIDAAVHAGATWNFPLTAAREHGLFVCSGDATLEGQPLDVNTLYYLETGRTERQEPRRRPSPPSRRHAVRRAGADVVELRRPHARGDRRRAGRLGGRAVRRGDGVQRAAHACAAVAEAGASESGELKNLCHPPPAARRSPPPARPPRTSPPDSRGSPRRSPVACS
jgi:redox-sensitive bicupin YhaK (pirin superfamily)